MTSLPAPDWLHPDFRVVGDGADGVRAIIAALAQGERSDREVLLSRSAPPCLGGPGFAVGLETSGTTGPPKPARHSFRRLCGRLRWGVGEEKAARWLLTYHPCAFAGLQVILTAARSGATLIVAAPGADAAMTASTGISENADHISGTPSFWRGFLMSRPPPYPDLRVVTLGGEAADQALLDHLRAAFPGAKLRHIYASTEAGALFAVADGREGFPAAWLADGVDGVKLQIRDGELWVNSPRAMLDTADDHADGSRLIGDLPTGDLVEIRDDRVIFTGRKDGRVNVGGIKVSPEAVEALILALEGVADALVAAAPNPITGNVLTATIVPRPNADAERLRQAVREATAGLPPAARPRIVTFTETLPLSPSGKKSRVAL
jgi:acyl-coenzyme A synthetase/AMP-(fatty) acid ligase